MQNQRKTVPKDGWIDYLSTEDPRKIVDAAGWRDSITSTLVQAEKKRSRHFICIEKEGGVVETPVDLVHAKTRPVVKEKEGTR